jgi:FixJ family two-component response regulator
MASKQTIFVVDDDDGFSKTMATLLRTLGYQPELYASAETFLSAVAARDAGRCCALIDIQLDGMSGIELARHLERDGPSLPVIFITGNDSEAARNAALQQRCVAYLTKPFAAAALIEAIHRALA